MLLLVQYQRLSARGSLTDGLLWSTKMIAERLSSSEQSTSVALLSMLRLGYIEQRGKEWVKTIDGEALFLEEIRNTKINASPWAFREEALTGMDSKGNRSRITRAALPSATAENSSRNREEDDMLSISLRGAAIKAIARDLGLTKDEVVEGLNTGRVGRCKGIHGVEHWGIFHKRSEGGWKHLCKDCLNQKRRK